MHDRDRFCAVCGYGLNHIEGGATPEHWEHPWWVKDCPVPVPVKVDEIRANLRCDFCHDDPQPTPWIVPFKDVDSSLFEGSGQQFKMGGPWLACSVCADLVTGEKWGRLIRRAGTALADRQGLTDPVMVDRLIGIIAQQYRDLRAVQDGPPRPGVPIETT